MRPRVYITGIAVLLVVAMALAIYFFFSGGGINPISGGTGTLPAVTSTISIPPPPSGSEFVIGTPRGSVSVKNFYSNPVLVTPDKQTVLFSSTADYNIVYFVPDSSFSIAILSKPVQSAKDKAEAAFLDKLGISKTDACKLIVTVGVPISIDPDFAGRNLGLSFCGSVLQ